MACNMKSSVFYTSSSQQALQWLCRGSQHIIRNNAPSGHSHLSHKAATAQKRKLLVAQSSQTSEGGATAIEGANASDQANDEQRRGYRSFQMEKCEFLVAETPEGLLTVSDAFVVDAAGSYEQPALQGDLPNQPQLYQVVEWASEYRGNVLEDKPAKRWVFKVYLIKIKAMEPYSVDMEEVYCIDGAFQRIFRCEVHRLAPPDTDPKDLRLRIRDNVVTIDSVQSLPSPEAVVQARMQGVAASSRLELEREEAGGAEAEALARADGMGGVGNMASASESFDSDLLYDEDALKDFLVDVDDEGEEYDDEFDTPASDY